MSGESRPRVERLTFLRFVAALIVVIFHYGQEATGLTGILVAGPQMVTFFFVLSGFVLMLAYWPGDQRSPPRFWTRRLLRIAPAYLVALATVAMIQVYAGDLDLFAMLLSLTFVQSWLSPYPLSLNAPAWSVSVEVFFYLSFPTTLLAIRRFGVRPRALVLFALLLWLVTQALLASMLSTEFYEGFGTLSHDLIFYFPPSHYCSFLLGIAGGLWFTQRTPTRREAAAAAVAFASTCVLIVVLIDAEPTIRTLLGFRPAFASSLYSPLFLVLVLSLSSSPARFLSVLAARPLVYLGEISYAFYILQMPVGIVYFNNLTAWFTLTSSQEFTGYLVLLLAVSAAVHRFIERPMMRGRRGTGR